MKAGRMRRNIVLLVLGVACLFLSSAAQASDYLGQHCWQLAGNYDDIFKFAVTDMGDNHYLINGRRIFSNGSTIWPLSGNLEVGQQNGNDAIYVAFSGGSSYGSSIAVSMQVNWVLSLSTLNGSGTMTFTTSYEQGQSSIVLRQMTINYISCP